MAQIPSEVIDIVNKYVEIIKNDVKIEKVILYGSYAKGNYNEKSDIDLALIISGYNSNDFINMGTFLLDKSFVLKADLQPFPFSIEEYNNPKGIMEEVLNTGIELQIAA